MKEILDGYLDGRTDRIRCEREKLACFIYRKRVKVEIEEKKETEKGSVNETGAEIKTEKEEIKDEFASQEVKKERMRVERLKRSKEAKVEMEETRLLLERIKGKCPYCI